MNLQDKLDHMKKGLVCLVPRAGLGGITCHEKTLCDCQVLGLIAALEKAISQRNKALELTNYRVISDHQLKCGIEDLDKTLVELL